MAGRLQLVFLIQKHTFQSQNSNFYQTVSALIGGDVSETEILKELATRAGPLNQWEFGWATRL